jgi:hypothetical protein
MSNYTKSNPVSGKWFRASEVQSGAQAKLKSETNPMQSQFKNKDGSVKMQDVSKILIKGAAEPVNIAMNRATIDGLVDAYGEDSANWIDKLLTIETEKVLIGGKRVTVAYLIPEGYDRVEDEMGYMHITKKGTKAETPEMNLEDEPEQEERPS